MKKNTACKSTNNAKGGATTAATVQDSCWIVSMRKGRVCVVEQRYVLRAVDAL